MTKAFAKSLTRWWNVFLIDVEEKPEILKRFRQGRSHVLRNRQLYWDYNKGTVEIRLLFRPQHLTLNNL